MTGLLLVGGFFRSLQFTSVNALAFADVPNDRMSRATTLTSVAQQLSLSIGVSVGAMALELTVEATGGDIGPTSFVPAFLVVGSLTVLSAIPFALLGPRCRSGDVGPPADRTRPGHGHARPGLDALVDRDCDNRSRGVTSPGGNHPLDGQGSGIMEGDAVAVTSQGWLMAVIIAIVIGAIAGWLAGLIVEGVGFGLLGNIIVGIIGAIIASFLLPAIGVNLGGGWIAAIIAAVIGAVILLLIIGLFKRA